MAIEQLGAERCGGLCTVPWRIAADAAAAADESTMLEGLGFGTEDASADGGDLDGFGKVPSFMRIFLCKM